jgi:hypothetical protein
MVKPTIFLAIPAYKDPLVMQTVLWAVQAATHPERVHFGIVDQCDPGTEWPVTQIVRNPQIRYLAVPAEASRGLGWARAMAMALYDQEDLFLQIDAHTYFRQGWDVWLEQAIADRQLMNLNSVLTSYPIPFTMTDGVPSVTWQPNLVVRTRISPNTTFTEDKVTLEQNGVYETSTVPLPAFGISGGFVAAPGRFVQQFPADPWIYFFGEEEMLAIRLYTHGWDMWHPVNAPFAHLYNDGTNRELHWKAEQDEQRLRRWWQFDAVSKARQRALLYEEADLGVYGLGTVRTLRDFATFCGIDYRAKTVDPKAWI